jgi:hypothetical protein
MEDIYKFLVVSVILVVLCLYYRPVIEKLDNGIIIHYGRHNNRKEFIYYYE